VLAGFSVLDLHPDVAEGVHALRDRGLRLVTLTNGSRQIAERLLSTAAIRGEFEMLMSVELEAVHPWDTDGAARAGMATGWVNRSHRPYPGHFRRHRLNLRT